ncbi:hypothetical protein GCM10009566_47680 [Streptomyces murinus]
MGEWPGAWGSGVPGGAGLGAGAGSPEGPTISRASRAGACTTRGDALPSVRGADCCEGAALGGGPGAAVCRTVTQPVRAETATVTRSAAVVVVRCTRVTMLVPEPVGIKESSRMPPPG